MLTDVPTPLADLRPFLSSNLGATEESKEEDRSARSPSSGVFHSIISERGGSVEEDESRPPRGGLLRGSVAIVPDDEEDNPAWRRKVGEKSLGSSHSTLAVVEHNNASCCRKLVGYSGVGFVIGVG